MNGSKEADRAPDPDPESFNPVGTMALLAVYFVILSVMWIFMYFVEFLGKGPTVIGP